MMETKSRKSERIRVDTVARLDLGGVEVELPVLDVGPGGVFVKADLLLEEGERFGVTVALPHGEVRALGEVVRAQGVSRNPWSGELYCPGFGVRFLEVDEASARVLRRVAA